LSRSNFLLTRRFNARAVSSTLQKHETGRHFPVNSQIVRH